MAASICRNLRWNQHRKEETYIFWIELMDFDQTQDEHLKDALAASIAYWINNERVLEMVLARVAEIPELDSLNAELLADAFESIEIDAGTLMSAYMKSKQGQSIIYLNHDLERRRVDRIDEHGR